MQAEAERETGGVQFGGAAAPADGKGYSCWRLNCLLGCRLAVPARRPALLHPTHLHPLHCSREPVAGLFTDVESKLAGAAAAHEERVRSSQQSEASGEAAPLAGAAADASSSSGTAGGGGGSGKAALVEKMAAKLGGTKDFLESHLMRASVLGPVDPDPDGAAPPPAAAPAAEAIGGGKPAAGDGASAAAPAAAASAANGAANAASAAAGGEEEDEDMHHAAGMGATAVSVVLRGNKVIVANTGEGCRRAVDRCVDREAVLLPGLHGRQASSARAGGRAAQQQAAVLVLSAA